MIKDWIRTWYRQIVVAVTDFPMAVLYTALLGTISYFPILTSYFHSDDWFHLSISQVSQPIQIVKFFAPWITEVSTPVYRPISTQVFFWLWQSLFELWSPAFFAVQLGLFFLTILLVYRITLILTKDTRLSFYCLWFFSFSSAHLPQLGYISTVQESWMVVFTLGAILVWLRQKPFFQLYSVCLFALALLSKETAVVVPFLIGAIEFWRSKKIAWKLWPMFAITGLYLVSYAFFRGFGHTVGDASYSFSFSLRVIANTTIWYSWWSVGMPEMLADYMPTFFTILPRWFADFPKVGASIWLAFIVLVVSALWRVGQVWKVRWQLWLLAAMFFFIGLGPHLLLPSHKYVFGLPIPLIGCSLFLASLVSPVGKRWMSGLLIGSFLLLNALTWGATWRVHWVFERARTARAVDVELGSLPPSEVALWCWYFVNDGQGKNQHWGISRQVQLALFRDGYFRARYRLENPCVRYEDDGADVQKDAVDLPIKSVSAREFLE